MAEDTRSVLEKRHIRFGWWSLAIFASLGLILEALHGLKLGLYLDVGNSTRRLMWTLSHAHGSLLALINLAFAGAIARFSHWPQRPRGIASACLLASTVLLPGGFFVGGIVIYGGDPGLGALLVPPGGVLLVVSLVLTAVAATRRGHSPPT